MKKECSYCNDSEDIIYILYECEVNTDLWGGFLIISAIRRFFAGFLRCDSRTIMKSFLKKIACEFSGNFVQFLCKFPVNSRAIFFEKRLHYCTTIAPQKSCERPANRRAASDEKPTHGIFLGNMSIYLLIINILYFIMVWI